VTPGESTDADLFDHDPTTPAAATGRPTHHQGDTMTSPRPSGGLITRPVLTDTRSNPAPADPSSSWLGRPPGVRSAVFVQAHDTEAEPAQEAPAPEDATAERLDRLTETVETYGEALARIERAVLSVLDDVAAIKARLNDPEDAR
jgi:hypothetical protein